jgi:hypothetical protein
MKYEWVVRVGIGAIQHGNMAWDERAVLEGELTSSAARDLASRAAGAGIEYARKNLKLTETRALLAGRGIRTAFSVRVVCRPLTPVYALDRVVDVAAGPWEETCDDIGIAIAVAKSAALAALGVVVGADGN